MYRTRQDRMLNAGVAERKIIDGEVPDLQSLKDLVENLGAMRRRIKWWVRVGSKRQRPWSQRREDTLDNVLEEMRGI